MEYRLLMQVTPPHAATDVVSQSRRRNKPTSLYVRLRVPQNRVKDVKNPKLTLGVLKLGIAYNADARDMGYMSHKDNGYMAFGFECDLRSESSLVEKLMRHNFANFTVYGSWEYMDARKLAEYFSIDYNVDSYEDYYNVGRRLFVHMVEAVKLLFPNKYLGSYGVFYELTHDTTKKRMTGDGVVICGDNVSEYGFRSPTTTWAPAHEVESSTGKATASTRSNHWNSPWKVVADVPFAAVEILCKLPDGDAQYRAIADNMERAAPADKAAKMLHDYAARMWCVPPDKIDENFYKKYVKAPDASTLFYRARRFMLMTTKTHGEIRRMMSRMMDGIMALNDPNIKSYHTKMKAHFTMLLKGYELLHACLGTEDLQRIRDLQNVVVGDATMCQQVAKMRAEMSPEELKHFHKVFELKETSTAMITFKKIVHTAFDIVSERQHDNKRTNAWHFINVKLDSLRNMKAAYEPACLDPAMRRTTTGVFTSDPPTLHQCVFAHVPAVPK